MRILLAPLEGFLAGDIAVILGGESFSLDRAESLDDVAPMARHYHYDVIMFGAGQAGGPGVDFIRRLRGVGCQLPAHYSEPAQQRNCSHGARADRRPPSPGATPD